MENKDSKTKKPVDTTKPADSNRGCLVIAGVVVGIFILAYFISVAFESFGTGGSGGGSGGSNTTASSSDSNKTSSSNNGKESVQATEKEITAEDLKSLIQSDDLEELSKMVNSIPTELQDEITEEADKQVLFTLLEMDSVEEISEENIEDVNAYVINIAKMATDVSEYAKNISYVEAAFYDKNSEVYSIYNLMNYMSRYLPTESELENYVEGENPELDEKVAICIDLLSQVQGLANGEYETNPTGKIFDVQKLAETDVVHGFKVNNVNVETDEKNRVTDVVLSFEGNVDVQATKVRFSEMNDKYYMEYEEFPFEIVCDYLGLGLEDAGIKSSSYIVNEDDLDEFFTQNQLDLLKERGSDYFYNGIPVETSASIKEMHVELHMDSENLNSMIVNITADM